MRVFERLIPVLQDSLQASGSVILGPERLPLDKAHFRGLSPAVGPSLVFVDGGNGEVLRGANVSVQFVRVFASLYENNVRVARELREVMVVVLAHASEYRVSVCNLDGDEVDRFVFDMFDPVLSFGKRKAEPYSVAGYVRKVLEVKLAREWCGKLSENGVLVRDGDLEADGEVLKLAMAELKREAASRNVVLCGLSKTTTLTTEQGASAVSAVRRLAPEGAWVYHAGGMLAFVKLHPKAKYVFRCDVVPHSRLGAAWAALAANSKDPAFLGYPYGLVEADKFAQVPKDELSQLRVRFAVMSKGAFRDIEAGVDAHDILDAL